MKYLPLLAVLALTTTALGQVASSGDPIIGLCCLPDGGCAGVLGGDGITEAACIDQGGSWAGAGTHCGGAPCEYCCWDTTICTFWVPPPAVWWACCNSIGDCSGPMSQCNCVGPGGERGLWMIDDSECSPGVCPLTGGCELPDGSCTSVKTALWCCRNRGFFRGEGSTCALPCPADIDGDRAVNVPDLLILLAWWGLDPGGPPDLDGDGTVAVPDLLLLLGVWGPCP